MINECLLTEPLCDNLGEVTKESAPYDVIKVVSILRLKITVKFRVKFQ